MRWYADSITPVVQPMRYKAPSATVIIEATGIYMYSGIILLVILYTVGNTAHKTRLLYGVKI